MIQRLILAVLEMGIVYERDGELWADKLEEALAVANGIHLPEIFQKLKSMRPDDIGWQDCIALIEKKFMEDPTDANQLLL
jgi:hypothetical protein